MGVRAQKKQQKGTFHECWIGTENFENHNLTTTISVLMKLTTIMYLCKIFNSAKENPPGHNP